MAIYSNFDTTNDIVIGRTTVVTTGLWSGDTGSLQGSSVGFLNDDQVGVSGEYYVDIYNTNPATDDLAEIQFAVAYGHVNGGGAPTLQDEETAKLPTDVIYSQYKNLLLAADDTKFSFQGVESDHIYVINLQRARLREQLDPGNWELPLSGANGVLTFIDDSFQTLSQNAANSKAGRVFNIVSGSITGASGSVTASTNATTFGGAGYGLAYTDLGILVLNPDAIGPAVGFYVDDTPNVTGSSYTGSSPAYTSTNTLTIDTSVTTPYAPLTSSIAAANWSGEKSAFNQTGLAASIINAIRDNNGEAEFRARSAENISSTHYFVRLRNSEFNYSNNPTFRDPTDGTLVVSDFKNDPRVYITTIGLYNSSNELLAVAKLSKPIRKSFNEEVLLRVRLDF